MNEFGTTEGSNIIGWKHEASQLAITAVSQTENAAPAQSTGEAMTDAVDQQRETMNRASEKFADAGRQFANGAAEKTQTLLPFSSTAQGGLGDLRESLAGLVEGVVRTNLRLAQEIFLVESPHALAELQQRFLREYFEAFRQGAAALLHATGLPKYPSLNSP